MSMDDREKRDISITDGNSAGTSDGIQTTVYLDQTGNLYGSTTVISGQLTGTRGREVTIQAVPNPGYVFKEWQISTTAISLTKIADIVNKTFATLKAACDDSNFSSTRLYSDGVRLYFDSMGQREVDPGWYKVGKGVEYILYSGPGNVETTSICPSSGGGTITDKETISIDDNKSIALTE